MCAVFSIRCAHRMISDGIRNSTVRTLMRIPFARTMPMSKPMANFISDSAMNPKKVAKPHARMDLDEWRIAFVIASVRSSPASRSIVKEWIRKIE